MKKGFHSFLIAILMVSLVLPFAQDTYAETSGDYTYTVNGDDTATITGYTGSETKIEIPKEINGLTVTKIKFNAFKNENLTEVAFPDSLTFIGNSSFANNDLKEIDIPKSVGKIDQHAFEENNLKKVTFHDGLHEVGNAAFAGNQLTQIELPESVEIIGSGAFNNNKLTTVSISENVTDIHAFLLGNPLEDIHVSKQNPKYKDMKGKGLYSKDGENLIQGTKSGAIQPGTKTIEQWAFSGMGLTKVQIPKGVKVIGKQSFAGNAITELSLPDGLEDIGELAFKDNQLKTIIVPESVKKIEWGAFGDNDLDQAIIFGDPTFGPFVFFAPHQDHSEFILKGYAGTSVEDFATDNHYTFEKLNEKFASGLGTEDYPYIIKTADQLDAVRDELDAHYELGADIDLSDSKYSKGDGWEPIGSQPFRGTIDGKGFSISNLYIDRNDTFQGLFHTVGEAGIIENVSLEGVKVKGGSSQTGGLAGQNKGKIKNSSVKGESIKGHSFVGGIVGQNATSGEIKNSFASIYVDANTSIAGGVIGDEEGGQTLDDLYFNKDVYNEVPTTFTGRIARRSEEEMKQRSTFEGWEDFDDTWYIYDGQTMPFLQKEQNHLTALDVTIAEDTLNINETTDITVEAIHDNGKTYNGEKNAKYTADPDIVDIDQGEVTAKRGGKTTITVSLYGKSKTLDVGVNPDAPEMDDVQKSANGESVEITGIAQKGARIDIKGGKENVHGEAKGNGKFSIDVPLHENQENQLKVTATVDELTSDKSEITVLQDNQKPDSPTMTLDHEGWTNADEVHVTVDQKAKDKDKSKIKTIQIKMGDKDWKDYAYDDVPLTLKEKTEGKTHIQTKAIDEVGNESDMAEATVKIDRTDPKVTFELEEMDKTAREASTKVTVTDKASGLDKDSLTYVWSQTDHQPDEDAHWKHFKNGDGVKKTDGNGKWYVHIRATDNAGNTAEKSSKAFHLDNTPPELTLHGDQTIHVSYGEDFDDPGYEVSDNMDDHIQDQVNVDGDVNTKKVGSYKIMYSVTDHAGNETTKTRTVNVVDKVKPAITLKGDNPLTLEAGTEYDEPGATAKDNVDKDISDRIDISCQVDTTKLGTYEIRYNVSDKAGNEAKEVIRKVEVVAPDVIPVTIDKPAVPVYPGSLVKVKHTDTMIKLPEDLPETTTLAVKSTDVSTKGYEIAGEMFDFDFTYPEGQRDYNGDFVLTMGVDKDMKHTSIYHFNDESKKWDPVNSDKKDGQYTANVRKFSTYGVLAKAVNDAEGPSNDSEGSNGNSNQHSGDNKKDDSRNSTGDSGNQMGVKSGSGDQDESGEINGDKLPKTATPYYNYLLAGVGFILLASVLLWLVRRKNHAE